MQCFWRLMFLEVDAEPVEMRVKVNLSLMGTINGDILDADTATARDLFSHQQYKLDVHAKKK